MPVECGNGYYIAAMDTELGEAEGEGDYSVGELPAGPPAIAVYCERGFSPEAPDSAEAVADVGWGVRHFD